ncbi:MAG TPA: phosphoribosylanthranilate isomerase [Spirochaetota bacterium]|nr:phosphoribosylanthranilate isomerase [Spirochaetota bacterium]HRZ27026.1 phosphoribosylanthranilate isomerase [Spirochaetota bacterium]HSA13961.1 phosphoribosylanthranilate isomerase [Spirochaetota bacterium]
MFVKVCGMTSFEHIDWAVEAGYSAVGIVMHAESPRYCDVDKARSLADYARGSIAVVGVALGIEELLGIEPSFDFVQLYRPADIDNLIFAGDSIPAGLRMRRFMYDMSRGAGRFERPPDWVRERSGEIILSGGLGCANVREVVREYMPFGVDVSSGVESSPGQKDRKLMMDFIEEVRNGTC